MTVLGLGSAALAQQSIPQPRLQATFPLGAKAGTGVELRITGDALEGATRLLFTHPGITATTATSTPDAFYPDARSLDDRFAVKVAADVPPGVYEVRAVTPLGISNARSFEIGTRAETSEHEPNDDAARANDVAIDAVVNGACDARGHDVFRFRAAKAQRLILHCAAQRLDARTDAVLTLRDAAGKVLARAHDAVRLDPVIDFTAPADGDYFVTVNDFRYRGGGDAFPYRLTLSTAPWVDYLDPPIARAGVASQHTVVGRSVPEKSLAIIEPPVDRGALPSAVETFLRPADVVLESFAFRAPHPAGPSNPLRVTLVDGPTTAEQEPNDDDARSGQRVAVPAQIIGRFHSADDRDWYSFDAKKGERLWIEVASQRLGFPTDPSVLVQLDGRDVAAADDPPRVSEQLADPRRRLLNDDPATMFVAPADGTYRLLVRDLASAGVRGDLGLHYLLSIRPPEPDFRLVVMAGMPHPLNNNNAMPGAPLLRRGGTLPIEVIALRQDGFDGPIRLEAQGLPAGVTAQPALVAPWSDGGTLVLRASSDASVEEISRVAVVGRATLGEGEPQAYRTATPVEAMGTLAEGEVPSTVRVVHELPLAVREDAQTPYSIAADGSVNAPLRMARGGVLQVPVRVTRADGYSEQVALTPVGLHPAMRLDEKQQPLAIDPGKDEATLAIDVTPETRPGPFTFTFRGEPLVKYARGGALADRAQADVTRILGIVKQRREALAKTEPSARPQAADAVREAEQALRRAEEVARELTQRSQPRDVRVLVVSQPVALEIFDAPFALGVPPLAVKAGAADAVAWGITIAKKDFGFDADVRFELVGPKGVSLTGDAAAQTLAKGQTSAQVRIRAAADAPAGTHAVKFRARYRFNDRDLSAEFPATITIER